MPVNVIGTLKPKNNGKFPVAEAVDIKVTDDLRLDKALENKADLSSVNFALDNKADKATTTSLQNQINNIIEPVTEDAEVQNARVSADGTTYNTLKARLDADANKEISDIARLDKMPKLDYHSNINLLNAAEYAEGYYYASTGAYPNENYVYFIINVTSGTTYYFEPTARYLVKDLNSSGIGTLVGENVESPYTADFTGKLAITFAKGSKTIFSPNSDFSNIGSFQAPYFYESNLAQGIGTSTKLPVSQKAFSDSVNSLNELILTSDAEVMNNTNSNAGPYVILADSVIYNASYQTTKCLKFDYDVYVIIETDSGDIRHGEFNSTDLNDLHSSDIHGIYFPFKLNKDYYHRFSFTAGKTYSIRIIAPYQTITDSNRLVGKKVYGFGDSLMKGHYSGEGMLTGLCRDNGMQFTNYAINGATVQGSTGLYNITNQITDASQTVPDFVVVDGMANDLASSTDLGQLTDSYSSEDFDLTTYYGALENELYTLRNKYMTANIIYVIQHRMPTRNKAAQDSFVDATLKTCAKWSIPVVNIYDDGQINCYLDNMRNAYSYNNEGETSGGNGTHLTGTGYNKWYAPIIKAKMLEILA